MFDQQKICGKTPHKVREDPASLMRQSEEPPGGTGPRLERFFERPLPPYRGEHARKREGMMEQLATSGRKPCAC